MRRVKIGIVAVVSVPSLLTGASAAGAQPTDELCENFRGPRDGKARVYHLLCD